jgi:hypothetical protein
MLLKEKVKLNFLNNVVISGENLSPIPIYGGNGTEIFKDGTDWD